MGLPNPQNSAEKIAAQKRAEDALALRAGGASFAAIARKVGYADESGARKAVNALLKKRRDLAVDEYRKLELERLDRLWLAIASRLKVGQLPAVDRALKIMERRAKLLGLDMPTTVKYDFGDVPPDLIAEAIGVLTRIGFNPSETFRQLMLQAKQNATLDAETPGAADADGDAG